MTNSHIITHYTHKHSLHTLLHMNSTQLSSATHTTSKFSLTTTLVPVHTASAHTQHHSALTSLSISTACLTQLSPQPVSHRSLHSLSLTALVLTSTHTHTKPGLLSHAGSPVLLAHSVLASHHTAHSSILTKNPLSEMH